MVALNGAGEVPYHAGAQLLKQAGALRAPHSCGRAPGADRLHTGGQQEGHAAGRVGHGASLQHTHVRRLTPPSLSR